MSKQERICQFYKLSIRKDGGVYPCCLGMPQSCLGNIFDEDIFYNIEHKNISCECELFKTRAITDEDKMNLQRMHIMFSHECQAHCVCCRQHKDVMEREEEHLKILMNFIEKYRPKYITVLGGEVLIQPQTLDFVEQIKEKYSDVSFDIVTNLCVGENTIKRVSKIFSEITISFLGFSENTYNKIMGLDYKTTIKNFDFLQNNTNIKLRPKYLIMPTNVYDLPLFLDWALRQKTEKIYMHDMDEFPSCCNLDNIFWEKSFAQVEKEIKKIFSENKKMIIEKNRHFISLHALLSKMIKIDEDYLVANGFEKVIKITS